MIDNYIISAKTQKIEQITNKEMYSSSLKAREVLEIVKFTQRGNIELDSYFSETNRNKPVEELYYQRIKSSERTYAIKLFLLKQIYYQYYFEKKLITPLAIFPSSIILSCQSYPDSLSKQQFIKLIENGYEVENSLVLQDEIILPIKKQLLIVDGQHRIAGLEALINEVDEGLIDIKIKDYNEPFIREMPPLEYIKECIDKFTFIVTFLVDFDFYEQGRIFATVNFTQKPVDKSFYYDIFGSVQAGRTIEKLLHDLTAHLNYNSDSPLKGRVKMLGKGSGNFSQAFFIEALLPHFKKGFLNNVYLNYINDGEMYKRLPNFFKVYFDTVFTVFQKHVDQPNSILLKTTGMGAIIHLMQPVVSEVKSLVGKDLLELRDGELKDSIMQVLNPIRLNGSKYFNSDGDFGKGGSRGLQSKLFKEMLHDLEKYKNK